MNSCEFVGAVCIVMDIVSMVLCCALLQVLISALLRTQISPLNQCLQRV